MFFSTDKVKNIPLALYKNNISEKTIYNRLKQLLIKHVNLDN